MRLSALILFAASTALGSRAIAHPDTTAASSAGDNEIPAPPPTYQANDVLVDEHLGANVPLDARFRTSDGRHVTLGELLAGDLPTILTFNYSDCPMLCSLQLNGLANALPKIYKDQVPLAVGQQYRIVTIDLEPTEPIDKLANTKHRYVTQLPQVLQDRARDGWTFVAAEVPGDGTQIRRVADAVGFHYRYIPERKEWAHPAALIFLASTGMVTRYVYGIEFDPAIMHESVFKAGTSQGAASVGFMNRCYHYDPDANSHARAGVLALRIGAASFLVLLVSGFGLSRVYRRKSVLDTMEKSS